MRIGRLELNWRSGLAAPADWLIKALGGTSTVSGVSVNDQTAMQLAAVWACVRVLSEGLAALPIIVYKRDGDSRSRADGHWLYDLLHDQPNPEMTPFSFKQAMMVALCTKGNAYAYIQKNRLGDAVALYPIPQDQYSVAPKRRTDQSIYYEVSGAGGTGRQEFNSSEILHIPGLGFNGLVGLSPIEYHKQAIGLGLAAQQFGASFFGNGANPGGLLKTEKKLNPDSIERLRTQFTEKYSGIGNARRPAILEEGMDWQQMSINPNESQFLETQKYQVTDICRIFRVPPHMVMDLERATWNNIEWQGMAFVRDTLQPWLILWEEAISWKLISPRDRKVFYAEFLTDSLLRGDTLKRYQAYNIGRNGGWLSANNIRQLENMNSIEGGDEYLVPVNMQPATSLPKGGEDPEPAQEPEADPKRGVQPIVADAIDRITRRLEADRERASKKAWYNEQVWRDTYCKTLRDYASSVLSPLAELLGIDIDTSATTIADGLLDGTYTTEQACQYLEGSHA
jgi:HK97 family phage portal protein